MYKKQKSGVMGLNNELKCKREQELVNLYVDGVLSEREISELSEHLETCEECREYLAFLGKLHELSDELLEEPSPNFTASVIEGIVGETQKKKSFPLRRVVSAVVGIAATFALVFTVYNYSGLFSAGSAAPTVDSGGLMNVRSAYGEADAMADESDVGFSDKETAPEPKPMETPMASGIEVTINGSNSFNPETVNEGDNVAGFVVGQAPQSDTVGTIEFLCDNLQISGVVEAWEDESGAGRFLLYPDDISILPMVENSSGGAMWYLSLSPENTDKLEMGSYNLGVRLTLSSLALNCNTLEAILVVTHLEIVG